MKVTKRNVISEVSKELDFGESLVEEVMDAILIEVVDNLCEGRSVVLQNFGTFSSLNVPNNLHSESSGTFLRIRFRPSKKLRKILPNVTSP